MARKKQVRKQQGQVGQSGVHQHQADPMHSDRTQLDGVHEHLFLIKGHLIKTQKDGQHAHTLMDSLMGEEAQPHQHGIFIGEDLMDTSPGTPHDHAIMKDGVGQWDGPHRHDLELLDGTVITSLLPEDLMDVQLRKKLEIEIHAVVLSKDRFLTFERAAAWIDEHGFSEDKFTEHEDEFIFEQSPRAEFEESSLKTMELMDGVKAIVGIEKEDEEEEQEKPEAEDTEEESAFDSLQALLVSESPILTESQVEQLAALREDFARNLSMIKEAVTGALPLVLNVLESVAQADMQSMVALLDRTVANAQAAQSVLEKMKLPPVELTRDAHVSELIKHAGELSQEMAEVFDETSFDRLHLLLKSCALTFNKAAGKVWEEPKPVAKEAPKPAQTPVKKSMIPTKEMTRLEKQKALQERSEHFKIEVTSDASLMFPAGFAQDIEKFGDPVNLKFPCDTDARAKSSRKRFKQFSEEVYKSTDSRAAVNERIVRLSLGLGVEVELDPHDKLDAMLPTNILKSETDQSTEIDDQTQLNSAESEGTSAQVDKQFFVQLRKLAGEQRIVCGVVLEPDVTDLHGDTYDEETVRDAAWTFMEDFTNLGLMHDELINDKVRILESFIVPINMALPIDGGTFQVRKGTWLMTWRIKDDELWRQVKAGELTGFSIGAKAQVTNLRK